MPSSIKKFADKNKARKYRNKQRRINYRKTQNAINANKKWNDFETIVLINCQSTDFELSKHIGRSVQSIQLKRMRLKGGKLWK